ncbi:MAG: DUF1302 family protein [SAR324 cluster bacterium]|nr:DUF1302 family protein [SAR324 cluster bacterium]
MKLKPRAGLVENPNPAPMTMRFLAPLILLVLLLAAPGGLPDAWAAGPPLLAQAESDDDLASGFDDGEEQNEGQKSDDDDLSSGFEDEPGVKDAEAKTATEPSFWQVNGFLRLDGSYNYAGHSTTTAEDFKTDHHGLSKLRAALRLELSLKLGGSWKSKITGQAFHDFAYGLNGREQYTAQVLESREQEAELREAFVEGSLTENVDLKLGRQIVVWGKSDNIRITDILNPLDFREPGLTDLADLRLPLTMSRLGVFFGPWTVSAIAIHEIRFDKAPVLGSDFYPLKTETAEAIPDDGGENTEYAFSLSGEFSGWDLAYYRARVFDDAAYFASLGGGAFERRHARISMNGLGVNVALGNWLLKLEGARFTGLRFFQGGARRFTRYDGVLGLEYSGIGDTTLSLEAANRHLAGFDKALEASPDGQAENVNQYVFTYRGSFLREKLDLVAVLIYFGRKAEQGSLQRYSATYELAEALDLTGGVVLYTRGDGENFLLAAAKDNDRVFFDLKWSF